MAHNDDDAVPEEVERRRELRGGASGLEIALDGGPPAAAVEGSPRSFFIADPDPDRYRLGDVFGARVTRAGQTVICRLEVIRKEIVPRRGVALRLVSIDPENEATLYDILDQ